MFFEIGLVLLIPVVMHAVQRSKGPAMRLGIPALDGLSVLRGFIPPHPGPLAAIAILHADICLPKGAPGRPLLGFIDDPVFAVLFAVLLAIWAFGSAVGFSAPMLAKKVRASLAPIAGVVLIVGAGGGFKQVLVDGGTGLAIARLVRATGLSTRLLGWIVAALIRLATGSATVATVTAADIIAPLAAGLTPDQLALAVLAVDAGSLILSDVNDAGCWLVKAYFGLSGSETTKTWSAMETLVSLQGLGLVLVMALFQLL